MHIKFILNRTTFFQKWGFLTWVRICHATITILTDCKGMLWSKRRNGPRSWALFLTSPDIMYMTTPTPTHAVITAVTATNTMPPVLSEHLLQMNPECAV